MKKEIRLLADILLAIAVFAVTRFLLNYVGFGLNDFGRVGVFLAIIFYFVYNSAKQKGMSLQDIRLCLPKRNHGLLLFGLLLPILWRLPMLLVPGKWSIQPWDAAYWSGIFLPQLLHNGFGSGVCEELLFRGYLMKHIEKQCGKKAAVLLPSLVFGFVHLLGIFASPVDALWKVFYTGMVGIIFSMLTYATGSLLYPMIAHGVANLFNLFVNPSLAGEGEARLLYILDLANAPVWAVQWITMIGPAIVLLLIAMFFLWHSRKYPTEE